MKYPLNIKTEPSGEPIELSEFKEFLREDRSVEDSLLVRFIVASRQMLERHTGYHLVDTVFEMELDDFVDVKLPKKPLKSGSVSISYLDTDGNSQTLASNKYSVYEQESPAKVEFLDNLPGLYDDDSEDWTVTIEFTCGYGASSNDVPNDWKMAVNTVGMMLWMRDGEDRNPINNHMVQNLLQDYKIGRFK